MKTTRSRLGLSIIAGSLSFVGTASALDLVIDGSYESSTNSLNGFVGSGGDPAAAVDAGWTSFTTYTYSANYTMPGPAGSGQVYLRPYSPNQTVSQTVSLARAVTPAQIDASTGQFTASAWFCTYHGNNDYSDLTLQFLDTGMNPIGNPVALGGAAFVAALPTDSTSPNRAWGQDSKSGVIPVGARYASITTVSHALSGQPDGYVDLVSLDVTSAFVPVRVATATPANGATGVNLGTPVTAVLQDGTQPLNPSSIVMLFDGLVVTPTVQQSGNTTTLQYAPPGLLPSASSHTFLLAYGDRGGATPTVTNAYTFSMASWQNVDLGTPIYLEDFNSLAEGSLPTGWAVQNFTDPDIPGYDLNDFRSDAYLDWVTISRSTLSNLFVITPGGEDFPAATNVAPNQVINGQLVTNLIDDKYMFAVSDRADREKQVQYLFTRDYSFTGRTNVYLAFNSIWTQNQDSLAAAEYSIDGGQTWLPALYMLDRPDVLRDGSGGIDASNTFAAVYGDVPNLETLSLTGGNYGQFIGVNSNRWATLSPFISPRADDDHVGSKRVEILRLAQADNRSAVRLRFSTMGTWSWYWGIDNVGFYSIATVEPPVLATGPAPATQTVALGNTATFTIATPSGTGPFTYQWRHEGTNLAARTTQSISFTVSAPSQAGTYDVIVSNAGGSITSPPPAAILSVISPEVLVTGQWDFKNGLAATFGRDLEYFDTTVQGDTTFGTTTSFGISDINGQPTSVMHFSPSVLSWGGYKMHHGAAPNGGGSYVNQYTLVYDLYYPAGGAWRSLFQTATANNNDGDFFLNTSDGIGISGIYNGTVTAGTWHRVAFAFDLTGPGEAPVLTKFIDGVKVGNQTGGLSGKDGRFALDPYALLFADNDGDQAETIVSSVQFSNGRRSDAYLAALGGPSALKIPGVVTAKMEAGRVVITWTGGLPLETATSVTGPWSVVTGATSPYTVPTGGTTGFYRPRL